MGQRITLSYSIDIDDLSTEVDRLYSGFSNSLLELCNLNNSNNILSSEGLQSIEDMKLSLIDIEYKLTDIENIVKSYLQYISSNSEPEQQNHQTPDLNNLNAMYEKLAEISKGIGGDNEVPD